MSDRAFIDTNVVVYLFDGRFPAKQRRSAELLEWLAAELTPIISTQVVQETFVCLTRKLGMLPGEALAALQKMEDASFVVQLIDLKLIWRAATRTESSQISFWDALIAEAALEARCDVLYSEDLQAGQDLGGLTVVNPFA